MPSAPPSHWHGTGSGPHGYYYGSDLRAAYYGGTKLTGKGQSVGLMELVGFNPESIFAVTLQPGDEIGWGFPELFFWRGGLGHE